MMQDVERHLRQLVSVLYASFTVALIVLLVASHYAPLTATKTILTTDLSDIARRGYTLQWHSYAGSAYLIYWRDDEGGEEHHRVGDVIFTPKTSYAWLPEGLLNIVGRTHLTTVAGAQIGWTREKLGMFVMDDPVVMKSVGIKLPYWMVLLCAILPFAVHVLKCYRRHHKPGFCSNCGYDLRASTNRCPECGRPIPARAPSNMTTPDTATEVAG